MRKRWAMGMTACVCALSMALTGCQIGNKDIVVSGTLSSRQVFTLDKSACSLKEAKVYLAVGLPLTRFGQERADLYL